MEIGGRTRGEFRHRNADAPGPAALQALIDDLPAELHLRAVTHASWVGHRADSYGRLAFLGDGVLGIAVAEHLFRRLPKADIGPLTKVHGQVVSGRACAEVAEELGLPALMAAAQPVPLEGGIEVEVLFASERAMASVCEAVIGACYLEYGFERTASATVAAFALQIELASVTRLDFKSALQERIARTGGRVRYEVTGEQGPPHNRNFEVAATIDGKVVGGGTGRSKKAAEQAAAEAALVAIEGP